MRKGEKMNVVLTKEITLKCAVLYLKLKRKSEGKDIQKYLQKKHRSTPIEELLLPDNSNSIVERRVKDYLKEIRIYDKQDEQYILTSYGEKVKDTGMVDVLEEGKYKIYFTQNDSYFKNKIFSFQRQLPQRPQNNSHSDLKSFSFDKGKHFCLLSNNSFQFEPVNPDQNYTGIETSDTASLKFSWKWKDFKSSDFIFKGKIENSDINITELVTDDIELTEKIKEILPPDSWDSDNNRYKKHFDSVDHNDRISFECTYTGKWKDFDVHIDKLPVEPCDSTEACIWRNYLLELKLSEKYFSPKDFKNAVKDLNLLEEGFIAYKYSLDIPTAQDYFNEINQGAVSKRTAAYWHIAAPLDLNPDKEEIKNV